MEEATLNLCLFGEGSEAAPAPEEAAGPQPAAEAAAPAPGKEEAFNRLITGEYRDEYAKRTQQLIDTRFKQSKELENRYNALRPVLDSLGRQYGVDAASRDFPRQLMEAIRTREAEAQAPSPADNAREGADAAGESGEQESPRPLPQTGEAPKPVDDRIYRRGQSPLMDSLVDRTTRHWAQEAQQLKALHPEFDMAAELRSPNGRRFLGMLNNGIPMQTAYRALHMNELLKSALSYAVDSTRQRTLDTIRARGLRPGEAAADSPVTAAQLLRADPSQWNAEDMNSAIRQAREGKKIYL